MSKIKRKYMVREQRSGVLPKRITAVNPKEAICQYFKGRKVFIESSRGQVYYLILDPDAANTATVGTILAKTTFASVVVKPCGPKPSEQAKKAAKRQEAKA